MKGEKLSSVWETKRIKDIIQLKARIGWKGLRSDEFKTTSYAYLVTGQDFNSAEIIWKDCYQIDKERYDEDPYIQLKNGDVLVTKDGTIGKVAMVNGLNKPACLNSGVFVLKQKKDIFNQKYLFWELSSSVFKEFIKKSTDGSTIQHLYQNVFDFMNIIIPPLVIQQKIADFLDENIKNIDTRIELLEKKKERYLSLRKAIISEKVNNNNCWKSVRLKDCLFEPLKYGANATGSEYDESLPRYIRITDIDESGILRNDDIQSLPLEIAKEFLLNNGDILLARSGATAGKSFLYREEYGKAAYAGYLIKARLKKTCLPQFLYYYTQSIDYDNWKNQNMIQATIQNLAADKYNYLTFGLPTIEEQNKIVNYLDKKTSAIDTIVETITKEIDSLKTYRRALINEAVTGKLNIE